MNNEVVVVRSKDSWIESAATDQLKKKYPNWKV